MKPESHIRIELDRVQLDLMFNRFQTMLPNVIRRTMLESMQLVGLIATGKYMKPHSVSEEEYGAGSTGLKRKTAGSLLGILSSRLSRSLTENFNFLSGGGDIESIRRVTVSPGGNFIGVYGTEVPYAAIHEYGGTYVHPNLFGRGIKATIHMPRRSYLNPALKDAETPIHEKFKVALDALSFEVNR